MTMINMCWGNTGFLYPYWDKDILVTPSNFNYSKESSNKLKQLIKDLHQSQQNAVISDKHIVIGNGATQVLNALFRLAPGKFLTIKPPYFSRFKQFAKLANKEILHFSDTGCNVITTPNNPTGELVAEDPKGVFDVYDLSYNWSHFTDQVKNVDKDIMVFSFAKAFGMPSIRIGWAIIQDDKLAKEVENYIEYTSAGVSNLSQVYAETVIENQLKVEDTIFSFGKRILDNRWKRITNTNFKFQDCNNKGMFLYSSGQMPEGVLGLKGNEFGDNEDKYRLNIGCSTEDFEQFLEICNTYE